MNVSLCRVIFVLTLLSTLTLGCRPKQRPINVIGKSPAVLVSISGMSEFGTSNYSYHLEGTGCVEALGEIQTAQQLVIFNHPDLKKGLGGCMIMVRGTDLLVDVKYTQVENVLWISNEFAVGQNDSGQLVAIAQMEKVYEEVIKAEKPLSYSLQFSLELPKTSDIVDVSNAVGTLRCSAPVGLLHMNSLKFDKDFKATYIRKDLEVSDDKTKVVCDKLTVTVKVGESLFEFDASLSTGNSFVPAAGKSVSLNKMTPYRLNLSRSLVDSNGSSVISVELKNGCPAGHWLDVSGQYPICTACPTEKPKYHEVLGRCVNPVE